MKRLTGWKTIVLLGSCFLFIDALLTWQPEQDLAAYDKSTAAKPKTEKVEQQPVYMRVRRDEKGNPLALQTSIVHFVPVKGRKRGSAVDLIGAVHIADKSYYEELNKRFKEYDVVLYELVAPEGTRIPKGGRPGGGGGAIGGLQSGMKSMLDLSLQLNHVDYTVKNLVHADMSPDEFSKAMKDRGESWLQMYLRTVGYGMAMQSANSGNNSDLSLLLALFSSDRTRKLKIIMAEQFEQQEGMIGALEGPDGSAIITARNGKCFEVLAKQISAGKKSIGVFYGAGHLKDMEKRLVEDFNLKRFEETWVDAWHLAPKN